MNPSVIRAMILLRLRRVLRDRAGLVWLLVMPMVFSFIMGQLLGDWGDAQGQPRKPRFMVYAGAGTAEVDRLLAPLVDHEAFLLVRADTMITPEAARSAVEDGRITAALLVPAGFGAGPAGGSADTLSLWYDSDRLSSQTVRTALDRAVLRHNTEAAARALVAAPGPDGGVPADSARTFDRAVFLRHWDQPRVTLAAETLGRRAERETFALTRSAQHNGPSYTLFFVMMFLMMSAKDLVTERQDRTLARLMVSRATALDLVLGFFLGGLVLGLLQASILLVLNSLAFGIDYGDSPLCLVLTVLLFAGVSSAGSVLLGSVARTGGQADGLGMAVTMTMAAVGGLWWPLEVVPGFMQAAGRALPTGQAITIFHDMIGRGWGLAQLSGLLAGLAAWFLVVLALAVWRLRRLVATT